MEPFELTEKPSATSLKTQYVNLLKPGQTIDDLFVLVEKTVSQKKDGNPYLNVTLSDKTGTIKGVLWDNVDQISPAVKSGQVIRVTGTVSDYKGTPQVTVKKLQPHDLDAIDPAMFLPTSARNPDAMLERLMGVIDTIQTRCIKDLLSAFFDDPDFTNLFKTAPAAKNMHHAYIGGLLEHSLSMVLLVDKIAGHYTGIDRDLLVAGCVLHDVGKTREFEYELKIDYSDQGRLLSHIIIGVEMITERIRLIKNFPEEKAMLLKHLIVSHHGTREFGSPEVPKTLEAVLLNHIDEIDSKINGIRDFISKENSDEAWTAFHRPLQRFFYKGKKDPSTNP